MKKLILLFTIFSVVVLGACAPSATPYNDAMVVQDIENLQQQVADLQDENTILNQQYSDVLILLESIGVIEGLNGQSEYFLLPTATLGFMNYTELADTEKDFMDKSKLPEYLFDIDGEFVDQDDLTLLLKMKYYGEEVHLSDELQFVSDGVMLLWLETTMSDEEFMARTVLMIEELRNYDFYIIGNEDILFRIFLDGNCIDITIKVQTMRTDGITISPQVIYDELFFVTVDGITYDRELVQTYYDQFITNATFDGYVLDFK